MKLHYTEVQKITLRDILRTSGLSERQIEDVFLLLSFKPERVQLAFYYRACGNTYEEIGSFIHMSVTQTKRYINDNCGDINKYIKS